MPTESLSCMDRSKEMNTNIFLSLQTESLSCMHTSKQMTKRIAAHFYSWKHHIEDALISLREGMYKWDPNFPLSATILVDKLIFQS